MAKPARRVPAARGARDRRRRSQDLRPRHVAGRVPGTLSDAEERSLDSTWPASETWEFVKAGLESARVASPRQVWCEVPLALARQRYARRHPARHAVHGDQPDDAEWEQRWALAAPLPIPDTLCVNTTCPADLDAIARWCTRPASEA